MTEPATKPVPEQSGELTHDAIPNDWWKPEQKFFGRDYMHGDDSHEGFIPGKTETLDQRTEREAGGVKKLLGLKDGDNLVDCPCGYGRHSIWLGKNGLNVVGLDINDEHLSAARERKGDSKVDFLECDMRECEKAVGDRKFQAVINMFYSFGFFQDEKENTRALESWFKILAPGGKCLIHTDVSPEMIDAGHYRLKEERNCVKGEKVKIEEVYDQDTKRILGSWDVAGKGPRTYSVRIYTAEEFKTMLLGVGFKSVEIFGAFDGHKFTKEDKEMVVVATK